MANVSKFETRFRGHVLTCDGCGKILRTATLLVLRKLEAEHYATCDAVQAKKKADEAQLARQGELFQ